MDKKYVVSFSGGVSSWCAARRLIDNGVDPNDVVLVFADTLSESDGLYGFLDAAVKDLGCEFVRLSHGLTPWELFDQQGMIGGPKSGLCSRILKRELIDAWVAKNHPGAARVFGYDWSEDHRFLRLKERIAPITVVCPMVDRPWLTKSQ